jgi:hypothetical protein
VSWTGRSREGIAPTSRLSPIFEVAPLYFQQVQQDSTVGDYPEASAEQYVEREYQKVEEYLVEPDERLDPYLEGLGGEHLAVDGGENYTVDDQYLDWHQVETECYTEREALASETWEHIDHVGLVVVENHETYQYREQSIPYLYGTRGNYRQTFDPLDSAVQGHQEYDAQEGLSSLSFWRPNRQY